jgi:hypothetical protein
MSKSRRLLVAAILTSFTFMFLTFHPARAYLVPPGEYTIYGTYRGVLPCADCIGVWTEVILVDLGTNPFERGQGSGTFTMTERFTGGVHGGASITTHGKWSTIQPDGFGAGTLELRVEGRDGKLLAPRHFYCDHGRSLRLLDSNRNVIAFDRPDALERVIPAPRPQFRVTDSDNNAAIMGRVGDTFKIDLPTTLETHAFDAWVMEQPTSHGMAVEAQQDSSILPAHPTTTFLLTAIAPGTVRIEFQRVKGPSMMVGFLFQISP